MHDLKSFATEWAAHFASCLDSMTGLEATVAAGRPETHDSDPNALVWSASLSGETAATISLEMDEPVWTALGRLILTSAGLEEPTVDDVRQTCSEVLQQCASAFGMALGKLTERDIAFENGEIVAPEPDSHAAVAITVSTGAEPVATLYFSVNGEFTRAVGGPSRATLAVPARTATPPTGVPPSSKTLDLLLEVELPVAVSFGRTQMRLKDAAKLTTGSIVELNRSISEPVEVIVNNCVIARGEVVVVEGNYGVRIQEIVSREERLRTLF